MKAIHFFVRFLNKIVSRRFRYFIDFHLRKFPTFYLRVYGFVSNAPIATENEETRTEEIGPQRVLVVHGLTRSARLTNASYTLSFANHLRGCDVVYVNVLGPNFLTCLNLQWDLLIVTYDALSLRTLNGWMDIRNRLIALASISKVKVLLPQDDYTNSCAIDDLAVNGKFDAIFTPLAENATELYPRASLGEVSFFHVWTGYYPDTPELATVDHNLRPLDLVARVTHLPCRFGKEAREKSLFTNEAIKAASEIGLRIEEIGKSQQPIRGLEWLEYLSTGVATLASLGGASIIDRENRIFRFERNYPEKENLICNMDGETLRKKFRAHVLSMRAEGPRIFEAASVNTLLLLDGENEYLGGELKEFHHYIPVKGGNYSEALSYLSDLSEVQRITANAKELLSQQKYSYGKLASDVASLLQRPILENGDGTWMDADAWLGDAPTRNSLLQGAMLESSDVGSLRMLFKDFDEAQSESLIGALSQHGVKLRIPETLTIDWATAISTRNQYYPE